MKITKPERIKLKSLNCVMIFSTLIITGCTTVTNCPPPSNDLLTQSGELWQINGDPERAATVMQHNGEVLMGDRDRVYRWQKWWNGCKAK